MVEGFDHPGMNQDTPASCSTRWPLCRISFTTRYFPQPPFLNVGISVWSFLSLLSLTPDLESMHFILIIVRVKKKKKWSLNGVEFYCFG